MCRPRARDPQCDRRLPERTRRQHLAQKEVEMIETMNGLLRKGLLDDTHYSAIMIRIVGIEEQEDCLELTHTSKINPNPQFLRALFDLGRERVQKCYERPSMRSEFRNCREFHVGPIR